MIKVAGDNIFGPPIIGWFFEKKYIHYSFTVTDTHLDFCLKKIEYF